MADMRYILCHKSISKPPPTPTPPNSVNLINTRGFPPRPKQRCDLEIGREPEVTPDCKSRQVRTLSHSYHVSFLTFKKCHKAFRNANNAHH